MESQLSALVPVTFAIRKAICGLHDDFSFINSERAFLDIPILKAASPTVNRNGVKTSSKNTFPGCTGFLVCFICSP